VSVECIHSHVPVDLLALLAGKDVLVGVIDVASDAVETPEEVAGVVAQAMRHVPRERLQLCTNCGMAPMRRDIAEAKLNALGAGAALARNRFG
jgi:5-methyltetrahydropteroyltriglutamate--homocysteine methyltransferase